MESGSGVEWVCSPEAINAGDIYDEALQPTNQEPFESPVQQNIG
jgi:hypothetical protein